MLLKEVENQLQREIKMGLKGIKDQNWQLFDAEDDMTEIVKDYCFVSAPRNACSKQRSALLDSFLDNAVTDSFFTKGRNGAIVLWRKNKCIEWLKRCKSLLEKLMILCHLLGGQPARATEMATLRWQNVTHERRGVYWVNGSIMLLAIYSKTRGITSKNRLIPR